MTKTVRLVQLDGKLPNLALMKLSHWHKARGDRVVLARQVQRSLFEPDDYDTVYASAIFTASADAIRELQQAEPEAVLGGTGVPGKMHLTVESVIGVPEYERYDYDIYPEYPWSIGFTQRGCRLNCGFCVVPVKEGKPRSVNTIYDIWRPGTRKAVVLLDNDFFGQEKLRWQARIEEIKAGEFLVCFNQGINVRAMTAETAQALASVQYRDDQFQRRRLYTAWDNIGHRKVFFRGMKLLEDAGIPPRHLMVYMLIGYKPDEGMEEVFERYRLLKEAGCLPYPMVYDPSNRTHKAFQRWVIRRYDQFIPWERFRKGTEYLPT